MAQNCRKALGLLHFSFFCLSFLFFLSFLSFLSFFFFFFHQRIYTNKQTNKCTNFLKPEPSADIWRRSRALGSCDETTKGEIKPKRSLLQSELRQQQQQPQQQQQQQPTKTWRLSGSAFLFFRRAASTTPLPRRRFYDAASTTPLLRRCFHDATSMTPLPRYRFHDATSTTPLPRRRFHEAASNAAPRNDNELKEVSSQPSIMRCRIFSTEPTVESSSETLSWSSEICFFVIVK